jgi:hypothetical protein
LIFFSKGKGDMGVVKGMEKNTNEVRNLLLICGKEFQYSGLTAWFLFARCS